MNKQLSEAYTILSDDQSLGDVFGGKLNSHSFTKQSGLHTT